MTLEQYPTALALGYGLARVTILMCRTAGHVAAAIDFDALQAANKIVKAHLYLPTWPLHVPIHHRRF